VSKTQLVIKHKWALGDTVLLTALVRDIQSDGKDFLFKKYL